MKLSTDPGGSFSPSALMQLTAHACYRAIFSNLSEGTSEPSLGGWLLYSGELDESGRAITIAGNVAGCATLAVTADGGAQKQAIRDGVVDFVVTSLDEALRILKNEIRKRNSVGVCVGAEREGVEREMIERGVLPDMVFAGGIDQGRDTSCFGESVREVIVPAPDGSLAALAWQVAVAPARWMPKLDAIAMDCFAEDARTLRWVRLSPRYFGRANLGARGFYCEPQMGLKIMRRIEELVRSGGIGSEVSIRMTSERESKALRLCPPGAG